MNKKALTNKKSQDCKNYKNRFSLQNKTKMNCIN